MTMVAVLILSDQLVGDYNTTRGTVSAHVYQNLIKFEDFIFKIEYFRIFINLVHSFFFEKKNSFYKISAFKK
jgi:hypothetical protein